MKTVMTVAVIVTSSDEVEQLPPTPPGSCSGDSDESRSPKGSAPSSPQQRLRWHQPSVTYYSTSPPAAMVLTLFSNVCIDLHFFSSKLLMSLGLLLAWKTQGSGNL